MRSHEPYESPLQHILHQKLHQLLDLLHNVKPAAQSTIKVTNLSRVLEAQNKPSFQAAELQMTMAMFLV